MLILITGIFVAIALFCFYYVGDAVYNDNLGFAIIFGLFGILSTSCAILSFLDFLKA